MAKLKSILKVEGTLDELTFYKTQDGHLVRTKGGVSASRIANDPAFIRTRENGTEFGNSASAGKLLRDALRPMIANASDNRVVSRITQVMAQVKNTDTTSIRGSRNVKMGLATPEGRAVLLNFEFNQNALLASILLKHIVTDATNGTITIAELMPANDIASPPGATHVTISGAFGLIDFASGINELALTDKVNLLLDATTTNVALSVPSLPTGSGTLLGMVKVEFFQMVNGVQYAIRNGAYNALALTKVSES